MMRRTTVAADDDILATLQAEADRRGISLAVVLREAVHEKAMALRSARRPRVGYARSTDGASAAALTADPIAEAPR